MIASNRMITRFMPAWAGAHNAVLLVCQNRVNMGALTAIGISQYESKSHSLRDLGGAILDAASIAEVLEKNHDGLPNFSVVRLLDDGVPINAQRVVRAVDTLLSRPTDVAVLYFSGHAVVNRHRTYLITNEYEGEIPGPGCVDLAVVVDLVNRSSIPNVVVLLDCCHAEAMFDDDQGTLYGGRTLSLLREGVIVIAGAARNEAAIQIGERSLFTRLLIDGLKGGAADMFGEVSVTSLYSYVDGWLNEFDQRPTLKANVGRLLRLRVAEPKVDVALVRRIKDHFSAPDEPYQLTRKHEPSEPGHDPALVKIFQDLKDLRDVGLVKPDVLDMYTAAMEHKQCRLTREGRHMWARLQKGKL
jgi:Caspase domain